MARSVTVLSDVPKQTTVKALWTPVGSVLRRSTVCARGVAVADVMRATTVKALNVPRLLLRRKRRRVLAVAKRALGSILTAAHSPKELASLNLGHLHHLDICLLLDSGLSTLTTVDVNTVLKPPLASGAAIAGVQGVIAVGHPKALAQGALDLASLLDLGSNRQLRKSLQIGHVRNRGLSHLDVGVWKIGLFRSLKCSSN